MQSIHGTALMTNQELYKELQLLRREVQTAREIDSKERAEMLKEFYLFKGKAFGFMSLLSVVFALVSKLIFKE